MSGGDPREAAFCSPDGPAVFDGVVYGAQIWTWDPFDVPTVHSEARREFETLLERASLPAGERSESGRVYLLLGEAGSGKTHLLRAFRRATHSSGRGFCGYLQLTSRSDDYAGYVLSHLVDSLELPYSPPASAGDPGSPITGLGRLADAVLDAAGTVSHTRRRQLEEAPAPETLTRAVYGMADEIARVPRFATVDLDLLRVMLFLLSRDPRVRAVASKWLRCEDLSRFDRELLGDLVPRTGPEMRRRQVVALGKLMASVDMALVLLVDQMEGVVEVAQEEGVDPGQLLRSVVNTLLSIADALPNAVIVLACLEELFAVGRAGIPTPVLHRLERDPEPTHLGSKRTFEQILAIVARRLAVLYDERGVAVDRANPIAPFTREQLAPLVEFGGRTRDMLHYLSEHRKRCVAAGRWVPPEEPARDALLAEPPDARTSQRWSDFLAGWRLGALTEARMADLLAWATRMVPHELGDDAKLAARADGRFVHLETPAGRLALAVVEGGVDDVERPEHRPTVIVRSTALPTGQRKIVVQNSDWRALEALREFSEQNSEEAGFHDWMRAERPLTTRPAIQQILELATDSADAEPAGPDSGPFAVGQADDGAPITLDPLRLGHMGFVGGPRSGRTTAALVAAEALLARGLPVVIVERKGDLARYVDPAAWREPDPAREARRDAFLARTRPRLWTPGGQEGRPLAVSPLPAEAGEEPLLSLVSSAIGGWMDYRTKAHEPKVAMIRQAMTLLAARDQAITVPALRALVEARDPELGASRDRTFEQLASELGALWLRKRWLLEGEERADVDRMLRLRLGPEDGRVKLEIVTTRFLGADADFWLARLLADLVGWCRRNPASGGPRGAILLDDVDHHLAPSALPAVRAALRALLEVAPGAGLVVLFTARGANDLEPAARDLVRHWMFGRVAERPPKGFWPAAVERAALDLAGLDPGQLVLARPGAEPVRVGVDFNLIPARPQPDDWVLGLARAGRARREESRWTH